MGRLFYVPLVGYYIVIPLGIWFLSFEPEYDYYVALTEMCYLLVPVLAVYWLFMGMGALVRENRDEDGSLINALMYSVLNMICYIPLLLIPYGYKRLEMFSLFVQLIILSFFINGLMFFLFFWTRNIYATQFLVVFYIVLSSNPFQNRFLAGIIDTIQFAHIQEMTISCFEFLLAGGTFWILGLCKTGKKS